MTFSKRIKRILVVWITFHLVALFANLAGLNFRIANHSIEINKPECSSSISYIYLLTTQGSFDNSGYIFRKYPNEEKFWPFITYYESGIVTGAGNKEVCCEQFNGIFDYYGFKEFLTYLLLPFVIILLYKLWVK